MRFVAEWVTAHRLSPFPSLRNPINNHACLVPGKNLLKSRIAVSNLPVLCMSRRQTRQDKRFITKLPDPKLQLLKPTTCTTHTRKKFVSFRFYFPVVRPIEYTQ